MDIEQIRRDFCQREDTIWFNSAGTSYTPPFILRNTIETLIKWQSSFEHGYIGGIKSIHDEWRKAAVRMINCHEDEVAGIVSTTHGLCIAVYGVNLQKGDNVVINEFEYTSLPETVFYQAQKRECEVRIAKRSGWEIPAENIEELVDEKTRAVVISHVEFTNGFKHDLRKIAEIAHKHNALLIVDAIQSLGALKIDVKELNVDVLAAGGHKWMCSPYGFGILYVKRDIIERLENPFGAYEGVKDKKSMIKDYVVGMDFVKYYEIDESLIDKFGYGTENLFGKITFTSMMKYFSACGLEKIEKRILDLTDYLIGKLQEKGLEICSSLKSAHRSGIISFMPEEDPAQFVERMVKNRILITQRGGAVRVALHFYNTFEEVDRFVNLF